MGKLHSLRRAIERNPEQWIGAYGAEYAWVLDTEKLYPYWWFGKTRYKDKTIYKRRKWVPIKRRWYYRYDAYGGFIRHVLNQLDLSDLRGR